MEIKSKSGEVGKKYKIDLDKDKLLKNNFSLRSVLNNNFLPNELVQKIFVIRPKLFVSYKRSYFKSSSSNSRFTLDRDIKFKRLFHPFCRSFLMQEYMNVKDNILEVKYDVQRKIYFGNLMKNFPYRVSSCSKYLLGLYETGQLNPYLTNIYIKSCVNKKF